MSIVINHKVICNHRNIHPGTQGHDYQCHSCKSQEEREIKAEIKATKLAKEVEALKQTLESSIQTIVANQTQSLHEEIATLKQALKDVLDVLAQNKN
jgi:Ni,Fe-hydrogenase III component G